MVTHDWIRRTACALGAMWLSSLGARAQCLHWDAGFSEPPATLNGPVLAATTFDDGYGPALFIGGLFTSAAGLAVNHVAQWNGAGFSPVSGGLPGAVNSLCVFDDGGGLGLYAGGSFAGSLARWNGATWTTVGGGLGGAVLSLSVFDDGSGPALYAGGSFTNAGGLAASHIAKWHGGQWSPVGAGLNSDVVSLVAFDDGHGPGLFAGGEFTASGSVNATHVAKWNGTTWAALGAGINGSVYALTSYDDGGGAALYVGGSFLLAGGASAHNIAKWNGSGWSPLAQGTNDAVLSLGAADDGAGTALFVGGVFSGASGIVTTRVARWNGAQWSSLGYGVGDGAMNDQVRCLAGFDDGGGPAVFVGGAFATAGSVNTQNFAKWNGSTWSGPIGNPSSQGTTGGVRCLLASGHGLYCAGSFPGAGSAAAHSVARWDGASWNPLGAGITGEPIQFSQHEVRALALWDFGSGPQLFAGGFFPLAGQGAANNIARWDGSNWWAIGAGTNGAIESLAVFDAGGGESLYVGGSFDTSGGVITDGIARWDGANWYQVGGENGSVNALLVFNDGHTDQLYAGGTFTHIGGVSPGYIARWNGSSWSALTGGGVNNHVYALCSFDDGTGSALYVGGAFTMTAGGMTVNRVAQWTAGGWSALGAGFDDGIVYTFGVFDDGSGPALYAAGGFTKSNGEFTPAVAKWNGSTWTALGNGLSYFSSAIPRALASYDDGSGDGPQLFVGGVFTTAASLPSFCVAEWHRCANPVDTFCFGDGSVANCPCANPGLPNHGCQNSAATGGARLVSSGTPTPDTLVLHASGELPTALSIFLQGDVLLSGTARFGDGLRCIGGSLERLYVKSATAGVAVAPDVGDSSITAQSAALGDPITPGSTRYYQTYYRDPSPTFCAPPQGNAWNVTNGVRVVW
jgi:hypothetical protein